MNPGDLYLQYLNAAHRLDGALEPWVTHDGDGHKKATTGIGAVCLVCRWMLPNTKTTKNKKPAKMKPGYCAAHADSPVGFCLVCGAEGHRKPNSVDKLGEDGLCTMCMALRTRLASQRVIRARTETFPAGTVCALCGLPVTTGIRTTEVGLSDDAAGIFQDRVTWTVPSSAVACLPCASLYLGPASRSGKPGSLRMGLDATGAFHWQIRQPNIWWEIPDPPVWVVDVRQKAGARVHRIAQTEVTLDPQVIAFNIIDSTAAKPRIVWLPRLVGARRALLDADLDAVAALDDPSVRGQRTYQLAHALIPEAPTARYGVPEDPRIEEAVLQIRFFGIPRRRTALGLPPLASSGKPARRTATDGSVKRRKRKTAAA